MGKVIYRANHTRPVMRYAIWNNKGGVGKTFLTFVIACEYADQHRDKKVIMLDLCPQAILGDVSS